MQWLKAQDSKYIGTWIVRVENRHAAVRHRNEYSLKYKLKFYFENRLSFWCVLCFEKLQEKNENSRAFRERIPMKKKSVLTIPCLGIVIKYYEGSLQQLNDRMKIYTVYTV